MNDESLPLVLDAPASFGTLVRQQRLANRWSQAELASEAGVSTRHMSFVETGRASPSRSLVLRLARVLNAPLRVGNRMLLAAGYAPMYAESTADASAVGPVRTAIDALLARQEPFPALVMNSTWDIVQSNDAARSFSRFLLGPDADTAPSNLLRRMFDPRYTRRHVDNWAEVARALLQRVRVESGRLLGDRRLSVLLAELHRYPGVSAAWAAIDEYPTPWPVIPVVYRRDAVRLEFFSTVTTLGTPQDVALQELRIESFFPVDATTDAAMRAIARDPAATRD